MQNTSFYPGWFIRVFHWSLFVTIALLYWSDRIVLLHADLGYIAFFLVLTRVVWGIWGRSARLADYPLGFGETLRYFRGIVSWKPVEHAGVNPASAWMALLFFMVISLLFITGVMTLATTHYEGVWVSAFSSIENETSLIVKKMHNFLSGLLLALAGIHVSGALVACVQHRRNIIKPMFMENTPSKESQ